MTATSQPVLGGTVGMLSRELQLCGVTPTETVIVYSDDGGRPELFSGFSTAAQLLGATVLELRAGVIARQTVVQAWDESH